jgi:hypothetical protein
MLRRFRITRSARALPFLALLVGAGAAACARQAAPPAPAGATSGTPAGVLVVANQQSANATLVTLPGGTTRHVAVGAGPHEAAASADGRWAVVTVYGTREETGTRLALVRPGDGSARAPRAARHVHAPARRRAAAGRGTPRRRDVGGVAAAARRRPRRRQRRRGDPPPGPPGRTWWR